MARRVAALPIATPTSSSTSRSTAASNANASVSERCPRGEKGVTQDAQGRGDAQEQARGTGVDHPCQDGAGKVRLAGPRAAEQQQAPTAPARLLEAVRVGAAHRQRLTLPRRARPVVLEGPLQKPPRNPAAPDRTLGLRLGRAAPLGGEPRRLSRWLKAANSSAQSSGVEPGDLIERGCSGEVILVGKSRLGFIGVVFRLFRLQDLQV
jgi:hypothetical protein